MLAKSGVDTLKFTAGSVRSAAVSKAKAMSIPIAYIMSRAGWTRENTFAKYYDKHIVPAVDSFQEAVLEYVCYSLVFILCFYVWILTTA
ncbi:hypothetical protein E2C01_088688 [Portunus trituberculatus]|uniref:Tyr recombinase domain-containing protein n=1 Tax=Portunus trituberculatus TaxID=210409 RepID=A0A5B7JG49_PORTR|nr:hypothetical protein [Portunus trituberculatus]